MEGDHPFLLVEATASVAPPVASWIWSREVMVLVVEAQRILVG